VVASAQTNLLTEQRKIQSMYVINMEIIQNKVPGTIHIMYIIKNKCIEDDTKAAARQSPNCIKKTKK